MDEKKEEIKQALHQFVSGDLADNAKELLKVLGYESQRTMRLEPNTVEGFISAFNLDDDAKFNSERALTEEWESIDLLFQLTEEEIGNNSNLEIDFGDGGIDEARMESYLFFAIKLNGDQYTRTQLSQITREMNKAFGMPAMVLFQHGKALTFAVIDRRLNKVDETKDVLLKATLIKDINFADPHRAHIDILSDLSIDKLYDKHKFTNFLKLHEAWKKTLDTSELNKRFYKEIADWYFWAVNNVTFPGGVEKKEEIRNATSVIRLITRLIFVWFIKEKGLVPDALFNEAKIQEILVNTDPQECTYYKAILQNLFFATLNQEMNTPTKSNNRKFRNRATQSNGRDQNYMVHSLYRYEKFFSDKDEALALFDKIPFLNGGLFECLDNFLENEPENGGTKEIRIDGFSDHKKNKLNVPNLLFFSDKRIVDLNAVYDTTGKKYEVRGLIHILDSYKFTVTENTPIEEEVALDPELLGRVFENLLAAYNPETDATARKLTGSFYTPREIVDYMTDESLVAYLKHRFIAYQESQDSVSVIIPPAQLDLSGRVESVQTQMNTQELTVSGEQNGVLEQKLRNLIAYNSKPHGFNEDEADALITAIDSIKILDPACGSGAFPMGILHKLVLVLGKLDPRNEEWRQRQIDKVQHTIQTAEKIEDSTVRDNAIRDLELEIESINDAFARNELDFGRKLYLIENCIYGVDIQPIAVQIAKLRFFISLIVDQQVDEARENRGVRALPNLETKFVAANTLIGVEKPAQTQIPNPQIDELARQLEDVRRRHFTARAPQTKRKYRDRDAEIRSDLSELLIRGRFPSETAEKIAYWDPYDQNAMANWFDAEWMFGIREGFDVVIGNPPYVVSKDKQLRKIYSESVYGRPNLYGFFIHCILQHLLANNGILTFINPRTILTDSYCSALRAFVLKHSQISSVLNIVDRRNVFEAVLQSCIVNCFQKTSTIMPVRVKNIFGKQDISNTDWVEISQEDFLFQQDNALLFIIGNSQTVYQIFRKLKMLKSLKAHGLSFTTGKIQWDLYKSVLGDTPTPSATRLIWAENVQRYHYSKARKRADRIYINGRLENCEPIEHDTIIVQRTTAVEQHRRIIGHLFSPNDFGCPIQAENHTSYLAEVGHMHIEFVLGLLNSRFMDFIFRHINSNTQVSAGELNSLPFPDSEDSTRNPIIDLVKQILSEKSVDSQADVTELEKKINQKVYSLYDLTPEEIEIVEENTV